MMNDQFPQKYNTNDYHLHYNDRNHINLGPTSMTTLANWQNYIAYANQYFIDKEYEAALDFYNAACSEAECLFNEEQVSLDSVSAVVVSNLNLAELYQERGFSEKSRSVIEEIHRRILRSLMRTCIKDKNHDALMRGALETYHALVSHKLINQNI